MTDFLESAANSLEEIAKTNRNLAIKIIAAIEQLIRHPTLGTRLPNENYRFYRTTEFIIYFCFNESTQDITIDKIATF